MISHYIFIASFFILGAIVGSFLNVIVFRLGTGLLPSGRSKCFSCGKTLSSLDLVPIFSFLALRGRCRFCDSRISLQYPIVEALTGLVFLLIYLKFQTSLGTFSPMGIGGLAISLFISSVLIAIAAYDVRHKIIPDILVYVFVVSGLFVALFRFMENFLLGTSEFLILDVLIGPILFLFFYALWKFSGGAWMGLGDGKLALGIGLSLGFVSGLSAIAIGFWIGAAAGVSLILASKFLPFARFDNVTHNVTMKTEIPFAPFLILGAAIAFFFNINVFYIF